MTAIQVQYRGVRGTAVDGYDAIEKAQQLKPDLIILDLSMPRMNGIEAAPRLKKLLPQTPIVLFTSHHPALKSFDTSAVGIDAIVAKDGGVRLLLDSLQTCCKKHSPYNADFSAGQNFVCFADVKPECLQRYSFISAIRDTVTDAHKIAFS